MVDQLSLLKRIYSESTVWDEELQASRHFVPDSVSVQDRESLEAAGHEPNRFVRPQHDATITELKKLANQWTISDAAQVFVSSLWSAPMIWRSLLTGKLIGSRMPSHEHTPYPSSSTCKICGLSVDQATDTTLQWYWRMTNGTPLDGDPFGYVLALSRLAELQELPVPNEYDRWTFRAVLTVLRALPPKTRYSKAALALKKERLLPTQKEYAYRDLLETLALIGILDTPDHPGMIEEFTSYIQRDERPNVRVEVQAPLAWWDSTIGINEDNLTKIFNDFDLTDVSLEERPDQSPPLKETISGALEKKRSVRGKVPKASPDAGAGEAQAGDIYAVRIREGVWVTVYCHEVRDKRVIVEYLDGVFPEMPGKADLHETFRPRTNGRWKCSVIAIDSTSWVRRVAREFPLPVSPLQEPDRIPFHNAKELKHMASWCFTEI
ncbi:hypothetical protein C0Q44_20955 [Paenibacillus sp. PCH8]|uniref:hypothetical protein n=1 Tax=Paenibacillus sp. PCH8 TaxID=2066524 RepID=UPI000CF99165|nr:hypothetical protein [Paenibacillus sp. PCH8]PQP82287.1 hypothetical protein C0Q44_20955 [Paenibacillus sp. PCH8]